MKWTVFDCVVTQLSVFMVCLGLVRAYGYFRDSIPNGYNVPNPCEGGKMWNGVGHLVPGGGGERNPFGAKFSYSKQWNTVCYLDSDGDGMTNGQELGDPNCVWTVGARPNRTTGITHPGFCDGPQCRNEVNRLSCANLQFNCPSTEEPGVMRRTLKFPKTNVPPKETNYFCMTFDLDQRRDYHMIATKAEIDNENVMHHIILYGCTDDAEAMPSPQSCGMSSKACQDVIGLWTVGVYGECMHRDAGFRIGLTGYKRVLLEFHWNNPEIRSDLWDGSGMTIYYTPKLRTYDAGVFWTGNTYIEIPPNSNRVVVESTCPLECTQRTLTDTIYFTHGFNHMHYKGIAQSVEKISNGQRVYITNDEDYDYDNPKQYIYDPPIELKPGDELKTTCVFQSMGTQKTTMFGLATNDEMCFGFFTYYPKQAATHPKCFSWKNYNTCERQGAYYRNCNVDQFFNMSYPETKELKDKVLSSCNVLDGCRQECPAAIAEAEKHPCLQPDMKGIFLDFSVAFINDVDALKFTAAMKSCSCPADDGPEYPWPSAGAGSGILPSLSMLIIAAAAGHCLFKY